MSMQERRKSEMKPCNTAVVLAGGKSSRLPFDKQTIEIKGAMMPVFIASHLSQEFERVVIVSNRPGLYRDNCAHEIVSDTYVGLGPKAGILRGLEISQEDFVYFTGCDMPFVNLPFIRHMKKLIEGGSPDLDMIVSVKNGYFEPLNAFYSRRLIPTIRHHLDENNNKISNLFSKDKMITIDEKILDEFDPKGLMFINLNTPKDFETLNRSIENL